MLVRLSALVERLRTSLFFVPMLFVGLAVLLGLAGLEVDTRITEGDAANWSIGQGAVLCTPL